MSGLTSHSGPQSLSEAKQGDCTRSVMLTVLVSLEEETEDWEGEVHGVGLLNLKIGGQQI